MTLYTKDMPLNIALMNQNNSFIRSFICSTLERKWLIDCSDRIRCDSIKYYISKLKCVTRSIQNVKYVVDRPKRNSLTRILLLFFDVFVRGRCPVHRF